MSCPPSHHPSLIPLPKRKRHLEVQLLISLTILSICFLPSSGRGVTGSRMPRRPENTELHPAARTLSSDGGASDQKERSELARLSDHVSVHAAGRGNPIINLSDGHDVVTAYEGPEELRQALRQDQAEPLSLASADFDEDGVPDLVSGYGYQGSGIVSLLRGNVDSIYPNAPEAQERRRSSTFTDAPFLSPARLFSVSTAAGFIGAGDFNGDGHWDVVTGSRGGDSLCLLAGDGHGGFSASQTIALPGLLTAFTTGEINRADGLADVVVGVSTQDGARLLVFEGPNGALKAKPEVLAMPAPVTALALGQLDDGYEMDLTVGAGEQLLLLHGRDRKLSLDAEQQERVQPARFETRTVNGPVRSLAIGNFSGHGQTAIALLTDSGQVEIFTPPLPENSKQNGLVCLQAFRHGSTSSQAWPQATTLVRVKVSSLPGDDLVVVDPTGHGLQVLNSSVAKVTSASALLTTDTTSVALLPMRLNADSLTDLVVLQKGQSAPGVIHTESSEPFVVNSTADTDDGQCTTTVNGCTLREAIKAANASPGADTIHFNIPGPPPYTINVSLQMGEALPTISDVLTIDATTQQDVSGTPLIEINGSKVGDGNTGLLVNAGSSTIRGLVVTRFIYQGITIRGESATNNTLEGNYVLDDVVGLYISDASTNTIGGTASRAGNLFLGNSNSGVQIGDTSTDNVIQGNLIGTNAVGTAVLGNLVGVYIVNSTGNLIGGAVAGARNVISGNTGVGVNLYASSSDRNAANNRIQGNYIGTNAAGVAALDNITGVYFYNAGSNTIGGTAPGAGNLISGNSNSGIQIFGDGSNKAINNLVQGNLIGTNSLGTAALANVAGVRVINGAGNAIGGTSAGAGNVISGNSNHGIQIDGELAKGPNGNQIQGNFIGTNASGSGALGNLVGVSILNSSGNLIGGNVVDSRNVISGNTGSGLTIYGGPNGSRPGNSTDNRIEGNFIGTNATGMGKVGNGSDGVQITISFGPATNIIGGETSDKRNIISGNGGNGIAMGIRVTDPNTGQQLPGTGGTGITVQNNYIGVDATGQNCTGDALNGIFVAADSFENTIRDNLVACNGGNGVLIPQNSNPAFKITITSNKIFANSLTAIDLGDAGDTANDDLDTDDGANTLQNYPELGTASTSAPSAGIKSLDSLAAASITVNYRMRSSRNSTFNVEFFASNGGCLSKQFTASGERIGSEVVSTDANGLVNRNITLALPDTVGAPESVLATATATSVPPGTIGASPGNTSEMSQCLSVSAATWQPVALTAQQIAQIKVWTVGGRTYVYVKPQFPDAGYRVVDWGQFARSGNDFTVDASVEKFTGPSVQSVVTTAQIYDLGPLPNATYNFNFKTSGTLATTLQFTVSSATPPPNTIDTAREFVRQQYRDFLNREADQAGEDFWTDNITLCSNPARRPAGQTEAQCTLRQRETTSGAFFQSPEFQYTGYFVYRMYQGALGRQPKLSEFTPDAQFVGNGIVVNGQLSAAKINQNKTDFATQFVNCSDATKSRCAEFKALYDKLSNQAYVDALFVKTGANPSASERAALVNGLNAGPATETRASVLQKIVDGIFVISEGNQRFDTTYGQAFYNSELNRAFVLLEYFGYMKRDPDDAGYAFWLGKLNQFGGNFVNAEMVLAFISSPEYRARFGQP